MLVMVVYSPSGYVFPELNVTSTVPNAPRSPTTWSPGLIGTGLMMVPVMTTGMVTGMVVSMSASMGEVTSLGGLRLGIGSGVGVMIATYIANVVIKQRAPKWTQ